jgi:23S rRNA pseudouridine1911/1915/1917 synthase
MEFPRQALHATELSLRHPLSGKPVTWRSPLPADMKRLLKRLEEA